MFGFCVGGWCCVDVVWGVVVGYVFVGLVV